MYQWIGRGSWQSDNKAQFNVDKAMPIERQCTHLLLALAFAAGHSICASAVPPDRLPPRPVLMHDVVMATEQGYTRPTVPAYRTTADGRIGVTLKTEGSRIGFYLFPPRGDIK